MMKALCIAAMTLFPLIPMSAAEPPTRGEIMKLVEANFAATEALDADGVIETMHSESPGLASIRQLIAQLAPYDLSYEVRDVEFIGMTGDFALIRVSQHTKRVSGPDFMDNAMESVWSLRKEDGAWRFWSQMILRAEPLGREER